METRHLLIRRFTLDDAEAYWPLVRLPEVIRYTGEHAQNTLDEVREIITARPLRDYAVHGFGRMACIEKSSGRLVGFSGLKYLDDLQEVDIGYRFLPDCWGKGYATESSRTLIDDGVCRHGLKRLIGLVQPSNLASARVLGKLGLRYERQVCVDDSDVELDLYAAATTAGDER